MPKKKKRRLKKSVRRGCLGILLTVLLFILFSVYECQRDRTEGELPVVAPQETQPDRTDSLLSLRLDEVLGRTPRTDSSKIGLYVYDLTRRCPVYAHRSTQLMTPASCMKLLTAVCALKRLGPDHQYDNNLYIKGTISRGTLYGYVLVAMDDDPLTETFEDFALALRQLGIERIQGDIHFDLARRDTLLPHPTASFWDIPYQSLPLLMRGERRVELEFRESLSAVGIQFSRNVLFGHKWLEGLDRVKQRQEYGLALKNARLGARLVRKQTHLLREVLAPMLIFSSNIKAEAVRYHTDHYTDRWGGGEARNGHAVETFLREEMPWTQTVGLVINDGSGLSPQNRLTADFLTRLLIYTYDNPEIWNVMVDELLATPNDPVRQGSLTGRMTEPLFTGRVFGKTGTLTTVGVSSLSGYCLSDGGRWYAFSVISEDTPVAESRLLQDALCKVLVLTRDDEP